MRVKDVMTEKVATVGPDATLKQVAGVLAERSISGMPVVDGDGGVLGVVSEADIIVKAAGQPQSAGIFGRLFRPEGVDERQLTATTAGEAMTAPAVTVDADLLLSEAARLMVEHRVNRLPVLLDGKLVGIVSRADLVRAFTRSDTEIWEELHNEVPRRLWISPDDMDITVAGGEVKMSGRVETKTVAELIEAYAWRVPGVVSVDCTGLTWEVDDHARRVSHSL